VHPYLLYKKASTDTEPAQASLESLGISAEKSFRYYVILNRNEFAGVRAEPLIAVLLEHLKLRREQACGHLNPLLILSLNWRLPSIHRFEMALPLYCTIT
jgi:hypothetical protein